MIQRDDCQVLAWQIGINALVVAVALLLGGPWALIATAVVLITWSLLR